MSTQSRQLSPLPKVRIATLHGRRRTPSAANDTRRGVGMPGESNQTLSCTLPELSAAAGGARRGGGEPDGLPPAARKVVHDDARDLAPLAYARTVADEEARACSTMQYFMLDLAYSANSSCPLFLNTRINRTVAEDAVRSSLEWLGEYKEQSVMNHILQRHCIAGLEIRGTALLHAFRQPRAGPGARTLARRQQLLVLGAGVHDAFQLQLAQLALCHHLRRQRVVQRVGRLRQADGAAVPGLVVGC